MECFFGQVDLFGLEINNDKMFQILFYKVVKSYEWFYSEMVFYQFYFLMRFLYLSLNYLVMIFFLNFIFRFKSYEFICLMKCYLEYCWFLYF